MGNLFFHCARLALSQPISTDYSFTIIPHIHGRVLIFLCCRPPCLRALPSRKHLGRDYLRLKITLSLEKSSKNRRFMLTSDLKNGSLRLQSSFARAVCLQTGHAWIDESCAPTRDILKIPFLANSKFAFPYGTIRSSLYLKKSRSRPEHPRNFVHLFSSKSIKIAFPCGAFGKFG